MKTLSIWSMAVASILALGLVTVSPGLLRADPTAATGSITGKVVDSSGNAVGGAMVRIMLIPPHMMKHHGGMKHGMKHGGMKGMEPGQTIWHTMVFGMTKTADDGTFTVNNAQPGKYRIMAFSRGVGHGGIRKPVTVSADSSTPVDAGTITLHQPKPKKHHNN